MEGKERETRIVKRVIDKAVRDIERGEREGEEREWEGKCFNMGGLHAGEI